MAYNLKLINIKNYDVYFLKSQITEIIMIKKSALLFALSIFICVPTARVTAGPSSTKAIALLIESVNKYQSSEYRLNKQHISETIDMFHKLTSDKINPPKSKDFEQLQRKTRQLANSLMYLS